MSSPITKASSKASLDFLVSKNLGHSSTHSTIFSTKQQTNQDYSLSNYFSLQMEHSRGRTNRAKFHPPCLGKAISSPAEPREQPPGKPLPAPKEGGGHRRHPSGGREPHVLPPQPGGCPGPPGRCRPHPRSRSPAPRGSRTTGPRAPFQDERSPEQPVPPGAGGEAGSRNGGRGRKWLVSTETTKITGNPSLAGTEGAEASTAPQAAARPASPSARARRQEGGFPKLYPLLPAAAFERAARAAMAEPPARRAAGRSRKQPPCRAAGSGQWRGRGQRRHRPLPRSRRPAAVMGFPIGAGQPPAPAAPPRPAPPPSRWQRAPAGQAAVPPPGVLGSRNHRRVKLRYCIKAEDTAINTRPFSPGLEN
ncbi:uncharacterized protein LOC142601212 [Balearica regulorum gibbericeps]|uniref:uncharacterized protein LOC142601212 n=1 Tax=Balearica regulorum gibbericeps TaxID=100784 RepID=UPI003F60825A